MKIFLLPLLFFLLGCVVGGIWSWAGIFLLVCFVLIVFLYPSFRFHSWSILLLFVGYCLSYFSLLHLELERDRLGESVAWWAFTQSVSGVAGDLISTSEFTHRYRVTVSEIAEKPVTPFDVALILPPNLALTPGDTFHTAGKFSFPRDTPDYNAEKQLWYRGMVAEFRSFQIEKKSPEQYSVFVRMRSWFDRQLSLIFPPRGYDILSGIILWQKNSFDTTFRDQLKASGLMHIMVVSGSNVMMLIIFLSLFLRWLLPWIRILIISTVILWFVFLVGWDTPVWRAALMGILWYSASLWWYRVWSLVLPLFVAALLAVMNPLALVYDIGLQLSFFSVICIIVFEKSLTRFFHFLWYFFDEAMALTVAATLGTLPLTLFYFGTFSLVGPLANLLAAPAVPILMYSGIATLFVSAFSPALAVVLGYIPWFAVTYLERVITFFGSQRWSLITLDMSTSREEFMIVSLTVLIVCIIRFSVTGKSHH